MSKEKITVEQIGEGIDKIIPVLVTAVLMTNGEIIFKGQTIGWYEQDKKYIFVNSIQ